MATRCEIVTGWTIFGSKPIMVPTPGPPGLSLSPSLLDSSRSRDKTKQVASFPSQLPLFLQSTFYCAWANFDCCGPSVNKFRRVTYISSSQTQIPDLVWQLLAASLRLCLINWKMGQSQVELIGIRQISFKFQGIWKVHSSYWLLFSYKDKLRDQKKKKLQVISVWTHHVSS